MSPVTLPTGPQHRAGGRVNADPGLQKEAASPPLTFKRLPRRFRCSGRKRPCAPDRLATE
jgi:hypothetical protein